MLMITIHEEIRTNFFSNDVEEEKKFVVDCKICLIEIKNLWTIFDMIDHVENQRAVHNLYFFFFTYLPCWLIANKREIK